MRRIHQNLEESDNPFGLSIGDLMAALLLIFILLLASTLLKLQSKNDEMIKIIKDYPEIQNNIYKALYLEFKDSLKNWDAEIDTSLTVRFKAPDILFETNKTDINIKFKAILDSFFPRFKQVILKPEFEYNLEEVRIIGHTDSIGDYYKNMELSQKRAFSVLLYVMKKDSNSYDSFRMKKKISASGFADKNEIKNNNTEEGRRQNRRVEFKIRTKAEEKLNKVFKKIIKTNVNSK